MKKRRLEQQKYKTAYNMRIGYMAGWTVSHWADVMQLGSGSGGRKSIGQHILPETFYL